MADTTTQTTINETNTTETNQTNMDPIKEDIIKLYIAMFQRIPSESEIDYWYNSAKENGLINGDNLDTVKLADTMAQAATSAVTAYGLEDIYPQYANFDPTNEDSVKAVINSVYETIFNKNSQTDPDGVQYWTDEIVKNGKSLGEVIAAMENAAEDIANNPDKYKDVFSPEELQNALNAIEAFNAKVEAAEEISQELPEVKVDPETLKNLQDLVKEIHDNDTKDQVIVYIENHKSDFINPDLLNDNNLSDDSTDDTLTPPQLPSIDDSTDLPLL